MASNLRVDTILPSTGTTLGIGTASGTINFLGNSNITTTGSINAASATITGNLGVGGVLTYEDVTNIDSVGIITARSGINVSSGRLLLGAGAIANPKSSGAGSIDLDNQAFSIMVGGNHPSGGRSNNNAKTFRMSMVHYALDEEPINILQGYCDSSDNNVYIGGGTGSANSLTSVRIYTGANTTTTGGTERFRIHSAGQIGLSGANYGTAGQFLQSQGASSAVQWASVSTDLQFAQWRVTTPFGGGNVDPITNWSQTDANATLTQSGGIFSFPSTGYWEIMMQMYGYKNTDNDNIELHIMTTTNNSSYTTRSWAYSHMNNDDGGNLYVSIRASLIFDVTNTSTHKIKFKTINNTVNWAADSGRNDSYAIFKRLAAT